jgi:hypothetical protein
VAGGQVDEEGVPILYSSNNTHRVIITLGVRSARSCPVFCGQSVGVEKMTGLSALGATILLAGFVGGVTAQEQAPAGSPAGDVVNNRHITTKGELDKKKAAALGLDPDIIRLPRLRRTVQPVYPSNPGEIPKNTRVVTECRLETGWILRECRVVESGGREFDVAAAAAISQWRVTPLMVGDEARACLYTITLDFNVQYTPKF